MEPDLFTQEKWSATEGYTIAGEDLEKIDEAVQRLYPTPHKWAKISERRFKKSGTKLIPQWSAPIEVRNASFLKERGIATTMIKREEYRANGETWVVESLMFKLIPTSIELLRRYGG